MTAATAHAHPRPTIRVATARAASLQRPSTNAVAAAQTGRVSGLIAIAPTINVALA
jgi:hypothetical protein